MLLRQDFGLVAEEYAKKAVELDPKLPLAHLLLGELHLYKSRLPEAIEQFQKELELNPGKRRCTTSWRMLIAIAEVRRGGEITAALHLAGCYLDGAVHPDGEGPREERRDRPCVRALQRAIAMDPNNPCLTICSDRPIGK